MFAGHRDASNHGIGRTLRLCHILIPPRDGVPKGMVEVMLWPALPDLFPLSGLIHFPHLLYSLWGEFSLPACPPFTPSRLRADFV